MSGFYQLQAGVLLQKKPVFGMNLGEILELVKNHVYH